MISLESQCLFDVAIQVAGNAELAFDIAQLNGLSITEQLATGTNLTEVPIANKTIVNFYANNKIAPATDEVLIAKYKDEGIDFWGISIDFIVS